MPHAEEPQFTINHAWYAVRVRSNFEQSSARFLESTGHTVFLPTYQERRQWSDRSKQMTVPLFSGYVFCHMDINRRLPVLQAPGVVDIVRLGRDFAAIPDEEIAAVQTIVKSALFARPCPYLNAGDRVRVSRGPLAGAEGILLERKTETVLVVSVNLLQRSVAVEVSLDWVRPLDRNTPLVSGKCTS
jgi:transcription termination/antitermination protein NusG